MMSIVLKPIGVVHVNALDDEIKSSLWGVEGVIEVYPEYMDGLAGIEDFSHIIVVAYLHKVTREQRRVLKVKPRRLAKLGVDIGEIPEVGVFSTNSPHRPNPIAITIVELIERQGRLLHVDGLDLFDGTPVLDLKPYTPQRALTQLKIPQWCRIMYESLRKEE